MSSWTKLLCTKLSCGAALLALAHYASCGGDATPQWYATCGDPVCHGYTPPAGVAPCTTQKVGDTCTTTTGTGSQCDPMSNCNSLLVCATTDPKSGPGGCPISKRSYKTDIKYLDEAGLRQYADELGRMKLATYKYKAGGPTRLGFIIEDQEPSVSIDSPGSMVDLYGYTSMAVATLKLQQKQIAALQQQVSELSAQLRASRAMRK